MDSFLTQLQQTSWLEWLGTITGIIGVLLSIREKVLAWPLFITCYAVYMIMSYQASLPAAMILNAVFIPISIYGWWKWSTPQQDSDEQGSNSISITKMNGKLKLGLVIGTLLFSLILGFINETLIHGYLPYLDAFATIISFVAQWLLSRKYVESWIAWIAADVAFFNTLGNAGILGDSRHVYSLYWPGDIWMAELEKGDADRCLILDLNASYLSGQNALEKQHLLFQLRIIFRSLFPANMSGNMWISSIDL